MGVEQKAMHNLFMVEGFRVRGSGLRVLGSGFWVEGSLKPPIPSNRYESRILGYMNRVHINKYTPQ